MANWLELARHEFQKTPNRPAAIADVRVLSAVTAAPYPGVSGFSMGSNGSTPAALTQPATLDALLAAACRGVPGIDPAIFKSLLSPEDVKDIEGGHIPRVTLNAYARSFAEGIRCGRITVLAPTILKPAITERR